MTQGKVEICGVNTAKLPILSEKEKEALFARIKEGDEEGHRKGRNCLSSFANAGRNLPWKKVCHRILSVPIRH